MTKKIHRPERHVVVAERGGRHSENVDVEVDIAHLIKRHDDCPLIAASIRRAHC